MTSLAMGQSQRQTARVTGGGVRGGNRVLEGLHAKPVQSPLSPDTRTAR